MSNFILQLQQQANQLMRQGRVKEAIIAHQTLIKHQPNNVTTLFNLAYLLKTDSQFQASLDAYAKALALGISQPEEVHLNRAVIFSDHLRRDADAERELQRALVLAPTYSPALLNLGNLYEEQGLRDQAIECYQRILQLAHNKAAQQQTIYQTALARMAHLCPPQTSSDLLLKQLQLAANTAKSDEDRANLFYTLGRAFDSLGNYDAAFDAFSQANQSVKRTGPTYDRNKTEQYINALIDAFPSHSVDIEQQSNETQSSPLFICGMFRSGSTLVEQVLATHPQIIVGGELNLLPMLINKSLAPFPASIANVDEVQFETFANDYLKSLNITFPTAHTASYVTDKRPDNFLLIGLIKRLFPRAKIIHTTRHPMDNGLSLFMQHLHPRIAGYSADLADIGHYYAQYRKLMAHWNKLYPESIFQFDYDSFVREPEKTLSNLLEFLGLVMNEAYLNFHELQNTVKTASYWQVRRPLYKDASGRWQHYRKHLQALELALHANHIPFDA